MQTWRTLITSQFLHEFKIDNDDLYKLTYQYIYKLLPCDIKPQRFGPIKEKC